MTEPRFLIDINVGRLAKWLRIMGYDAVVLRDCDDGQLIRTALKEGRVIVTRDTGIARRRLATRGPLEVVLVTHDDLASQMRQVAQALRLEGLGRFSRCIRCNQPLESLEREGARSQVPEYVWATQQEFMVCPSCRRVYWRGTHWADMARKLGSFREES